MVLVTAGAPLTQKERTALDIVDPAGILERSN
jgi:hypothetical protein